MNRLSTVQQDAAAGDDPAQASTAIAERIRQVGHDLRRTLRAVLAILPGSPHRPADLVQLLGLNRDISSRILKATGSSDPLEVVHVIPGPEPLRSVLRAASRKSVEPQLITEAEDAVRRFDLLIRHEAGTRRALDAIISASLPNARERFELASRQAIFKGVSQLRGAQAETWLSSTLIHPSAEDPAHHDVALLHGALGMQRLRPGVTVKFTYRELVVPEDGEDESAEEEAPLLGSLKVDQFFINPPARLDAHQAGKVMNYTLAEDCLGPRSVADMLVVDHHPAVLDRYVLPGPRRKKGTFVAPDIPVKTLIFDALLHEDAYPGSEAELVVFEMGSEGMAQVNDPTRDIDRVDVRESIEFLGRDLRRFYANELATYTEMLLHICRRYGWDPASFRGYRCRIQYPPASWQVCMSFEPPMPPDAS
ncbi:MAG: hypothetical protein JSV91_02875 [Phycisphaerales bacterium]|nr:MAG: hypothetical protein JSV91_02875 [Phycisphaerales bacterium]